jgi:MFS family permease
VTARRFAPQSAAAFRHRAFTVYWFAQLISYLGTYMQQVALGYLVYDLTGSKWLLGVVGALGMAPSLVLALPAGVLADRIRRRNLILCTQSTALLLAFSLATLVATGQLQIWEILVISTISGVAVAMEMPARQALVVELVGREDLSNAIAWNSMVFNGARVVGPALGGVLIRYVGIAPIFYYNSVSFGAVIVALIVVRIPLIVRAHPRHPVAELREGLGYLQRSPSLIGLMAMLALVGTLLLNFNVVLPIFAHDVSHTGAEGLGWMWTAMGIGALLGSITVVWWSEAAVRGPILIVSALVSSVAEIGLALSHVQPAALACLFVIGWSTAVFTACTNAAVQARVDDALRGRVLSVYSMIMVGTGPVGNLLTAGLAGAGGIALPLEVEGIVCLLAVLITAPAFLRSVDSGKRPAPDVVPVKRVG